MLRFIILLVCLDREDFALIADLLGRPRVEKLVYVDLRLVELVSVITASSQLDDCRVVADERVVADIGIHAALVLSRHLMFHGLVITHVDLTLNALFYLLRL